MKTSQARAGFTLVELLVVMALIAMLAAMMIAFFPNAASSAREARAAQSLQGWLNIAKTRALRDRAPRGLRLWITSSVVGGTTLTNVVTDCQYIEQPDDIGGTAATPLTTPTAANLAVVTVANVDYTNGSANALYYSVQPGTDYLEVYGTGLMHQIVSLTYNPATSSTNMQVQPAFVNTIGPTTNYRILRAPRAIGDQTLKLPNDTLIDLHTNSQFAVTNPLPAGAGYVDILFAPTGTVISSSVSVDKLNFWVRAPSQDVPTDPFRGDPTIVSVFVRTGFVGAYPPDKNLPAGTGPYTFVK